MKPNQLRANDGPVLLNEGENETIAQVAASNPNVHLENLPLTGEGGHPGALEELVKGNYTKLVTGINSTTAEVARASIDVIGLKDGLLSSMFSMEREGHESLYLGDCAIIPAPDKEKLIKITSHTVETLTNLGETPKVAWLRSPGDPDPKSGDVVGEAATTFMSDHPEVDAIGPSTWKEARERGVNTFIFPNLDSGNIVYKILHDRDGGGWKPTDSGSESAKILQKEERTIYLSDYEAHTPTAEELVAVTLENFELAKQNSPDGTIPVVALLSFSTEGSAGSRPEVKTVKAAYDELQRSHPEIPLMGPVQWDSARDPRVYTKKTGKPYPGAPSVFIFPNRDSADIAYEALQEPDLGGRTAVGPVFQGLEGDKLVIDLSRGAEAQDVEGAINFGAIKVVGGPAQPQQSQR